MIIPSVKGLVVTQNRFMSYLWHLLGHNPAGQTFKDGSLADAWGSNELWGSEV